VKVFSRESLVKIDEYLLGNPDISSLIDNFDHEVESLVLDKVDAFYPDFALEDVPLVVPGEDSDIDDKASDELNCKLVYEAMAWLSPAEATDERLWVTLCFCQGSTFLKSRYRADLSAENVRRHWTWKGGKPMYRDNGLSRLWWMGFLASKAIGWDINDALSVLFVNSAFRADLVERQEIVSNEVLLTAILAICKDAFDKKIMYKREPFREFMKDVQYLQGRSNFGALPQSKLIEIMQPVYNKAYSVDKKSVVDRIFGKG
jgi:hypothetical protein